MSLAQTILPFIGGRSHRPQADEVDEIFDPADKSTLAVVPRCSPEDVDAAVRSADHAFRTSWRSTTPSQRSAALLRIAQTIEDRTEQFALLESQDAGKPIAAARKEIAIAVDHLRFFAGAARTLQGAVAGEYLPGTTSMLRRDPIGVVGQIAPWNYPLLMAIWKCGPALAVGNTVVLKPAETTPLSTLLLAEVAAEFLPDGALNVVTGAAQTGEAVVAHPTVRMVSITGSTRAGRRVAEISASQLKHAHLELGGKAPSVIFDDIDPEVVAREVAGAAFYNAGQDCTAATRMIVHEAIYDDFIKALSSAASGYKMGSTAAESTTLGPVSNALQYERISGVLDRCPARIEKINGRSSEALNGYFIDPTILVGVEQQDEVVQNEIFGPVVTAQSFKTPEEALALANGTNYALASSVWTSNLDRALRFSRDLEFGCVWVNNHLSVTAEFPHGGGKDTGGGKDLSIGVLHEYTEARHIMFGSLGSQ
ncbi:aminobutyraldehyde dehydrogenase [Arthrobacter sp. EpRS71]|uniref:aminobutyraldehyde dehydrogenase n=1 Tax=Arthrobacter sp. EpRS71 TaxID=1743141 RepID=UPI000746D544|nr:aminobutyraldehyde dehydrogenase [Arthrobacter sp. EpRS71]KUM36384.1 gamma-aminobutyraldehyde dehydrogenase [Arthrobacter sp. EpRS71]